MSERNVGMGCWKEKILRMNPPEQEDIEWFCHFVRKAIFNAIPMMTT
jgi:hypothetical protein